MHKNNNDVKALIDFNNKIHIITCIYILRLDISIQKTDVKVLKFDRIFFKIFEIVIAIFQIKNKLEYFFFFQKSFLLANTNINLILELLFLFFTNENIIFIYCELI